MGEIELYGENPEVVLAFCNIVHHKWGKVELSDASRIVDLVAFADMRLSIDVVRQWVRVELATYMEDIKRFAGKLDDDHVPWARYKRKSLRREWMLEIAALVGLHGLFWDLSRCVIYYLSGDLSGSHLDSGFTTANQGLCKGFGIFGMCPSSDLIESIPNASRYA